MKFNKLLRATVQARMPQWSEHVMGYKVLKQGLRRILKQSADGEMQPSEASSSFTDLLDVEVEKVNDFYSERIEEAVIILHALRQHVDQLVATPAVNAEQRAATKRSLVSFHFHLLMLQNYVALNFTGVAKILKKFDKRFAPALCLKAEYISAIVELPFYKCQAIGQLVEESELQFRLLEGVGVGTDELGASQFGYSGGQFGQSAQLGPSGQPGGQLAHDAAQQASCAGAAHWGAGARAGLSPPQQQQQQQSQQQQQIA